MATYVTVTRKQATATTDDGAVHQLKWMTIPRDHADPELRAARPGSFARHPNGDIVFVCREGRLDPWERQTLWKD